MTGCVRGSRNGTGAEELSVRLEHYWPARSGLRPVPSESM